MSSMLDPAISFLHIYFYIFSSLIPGLTLSGGVVLVRLAGGQGVGMKAMGVQGCFFWRTDPGWKRTN